MERFTILRVILALRQGCTSLLFETFGTFETNETHLKHLEQKLEHLKQNLEQVLCLAAWGPEICI